MENEKKRRLPPVGFRTIKTIISATLIAIIYSFFDRSACFACIGAVFGMGNRFNGGLTASAAGICGAMVFGYLGSLIFSSKMK